VNSTTKHWLVYEHLLIWEHPRRKDHEPALVDIFKLRALATELIVVIL